MSPTLRYDAVVIGAGVAGLTAAARLAEEGAAVCVVAKGVGSTHLAPGTVDVLGYDSDRVASPADSLASFVAAHPDHPYALVGSEAIAPAVEWFCERIAAGPMQPYRYVGGLERNLLLPTAVGTARPSALVPETMSGGDLRDATPICVVGVPVLRDFGATLCAANISGTGVDARAVEIEIDVGRADANALGLARRFDDAGFRERFVGVLRPQLRNSERVGVPAMLGTRDPHGVWSELERNLERPVFEIPTPPPSVPGMRVYAGLTAALRTAGGRLVLGSAVSGVNREGGRVRAVSAHASGHDVRYEADSFVLATGGFASGGIALDSDWVTREALMDLPIRDAPGPGEPRFVAEYFGEQPMARAGIAVDASQRAEGTENVFVAGAALPGAVPWREGSGEGIALSSGHRAAERVRSAEGATAAA
jgi:glycerol-3-phosphate dehydrogenase subunit B